jgi:hypothetical protein
MEQFPENRDVAWQSACQVADRDPRQCPWRFSAKTLALEADLIPMFTITSCPEVTVVDVQHTPKSKHTSSDNRLLCTESRAAMCWYCRLSQNFFRRGLPSGNRYPPLVVVWMQLRDMKHREDPRWDIAWASPRLLFRSCNCVCSLAGVRTVRERPAFTFAVGVTFPLSRSSYSRNRNTSASGWCRPGKRSVYCFCSIKSSTIRGFEGREHITVPLWLLDTVFRECT